MAIGAYAVERDYSHYVAYLSKTIFAVVGTASKGPIGEAVVCTSSQDLVNKFGPLKLGYNALYAGQYFLSQASKLYFVRAASTSAAPAEVDIAGANGESTAIEDAITVVMKEKGTYGNGYTIVITAGTTSGTYNIVVKNTAAYTVESKQGVAFTALDTDYESNYIEISAVNSSATTLTPGTYTLTGGDDGTTGILAADYITAAAALSADIVDMNLFAVPGISDAAVITSMLTLAENRGDCLYLVDPPAGLSRDEVIDWHNGAGEYSHTAFNSSYGALYYDWVIIYDSTNRTRVQVPPSVPVAASIAASDRVSELWYAPAGLNRGLLKGVLDSVTKLNKSDIELMYSGANNINSLYDDPQAGIAIWGQKTLLRSNTALDRVNVRRLMNYLKKVVVTACNYLVFEPNDRSTWNSFEMKIRPVLERIKTNRGIYEYRIVKGTTIVTSDDIDNYRMPCMVTIKPTKAAEEIPIYFVITSTGADFNAVLESNGVVVG